MFAIGYVFSNARFLRKVRVAANMPVATYDKNRAAKCGEKARMGATAVVVAPIRQTRGKIGRFHQDTTDEKKTFDRGVFARKKIGGGRHMSSAAMQNALLKFR